MVEKAGLGLGVQMVLGTSGILILRQETGTDLRTKAMPSNTNSLRRLMSKA